MPLRKLSKYWRRKASGQRIEEVSGYSLIATKLCERKGKDGFRLINKLEFAKTIVKEVMVILENTRATSQSQSNNRTDLMTNNQAK